MAIRQAFLEACYNDRVERFKPIMRRMQSLEMSGKALLATGIGLIVNDLGAWPEPLHPEVKVLCQKCRLIAAKHMQDPVHGAAVCPIHEKPFRGMKSKDFLSKAKGMEQSLLTTLKEEGLGSDHQWLKSAGCQLVQGGFEKIEKLDGLRLEDAEKMFSVPAISILVWKAAEVVSRRAKARRQIKLETMLALASVHAKEAKRQKLNCSAVAENLSNKARDENWNSVQLSQESLGLSKFQDAAKPSHRLGELLSVNRCKAKKIVDASTEELKSRSIQDATARSTKSGLRLWQSFATEFLDYDNLATLPPRSGSDVCKYVYLFNNHGTCTNYISHLRWACNNQNVNMEWDTGELKQAMKGIR